MYVRDNKLIYNAFPGSIKNEITHVIGRVNDIQVWNEQVDISVAGEKLKLPSRIIAEAFEPAHLTVVQKQVYDCIYSLSSDGHMREACVRSLIAQQYEPWVAPFLLLRLGDYVVEIAAAVAHKQDDLLRQTSHENPELYRLVRARSISYWNEYYHKLFPDLKTYPPFVYLDALK